MITIAIFNSKDTVATTPFVYHLAWMFSEIGLPVAVADLDPQAHLTSLLLKEDRLQEIWLAGRHRLTIQEVIEPFLQGGSDTPRPHIEKMTDYLHLIPGDLGLANFEDTLSKAWLRCETGDPSALRIVTAFHRALLLASEDVGAELVLLNLGPNLSAVNRAALIASGFVVVPVAPDFSALIGLRNAGPALRSWRESWAGLRMKNADPSIALPAGDMRAAGYVILQDAVKSYRPVRADWRWTEQIPSEYRQSVLNTSVIDCGPNVSVDPECLAVVRSYRSLMPMALEAHKPMFFLKPADGAIGAHAEAVRDCFREFKQLAHRIADKCSIALPRKSAVSF